MTTSTAAIGGVETSRLTVVGPARTADLTVPGTITIGGLVPTLAQHLADEGGRHQPWVLQRLGEKPFDPDQTAETLDLRDGDVLYLRLADQAMPAIEFDDIAVGVASVVSGRPDRWRPEFTRRLLLALGGLVLAGYLGAGLAVHAQWPAAVTFGIAAVILGGGSVAAARFVGDAAMSLLAGLSACVFAAAAPVAGAGRFGTGVKHGGAVLLINADRVQIAALCACVVAGAIWAGRRQPIAPYAAIIGVSVAGLLDGTLERVAHWNATEATAVLAIVIFMAGAREVRAALRVARLVVPHPPANAAELQLDIEPESGEQVVRRTADALAYLNALTFCLAVVAVGACAVLARRPDWASWSLAALLSCCILFRARGVIGVWQRTSLGVAGTAGLAITVISIAAHASPEVELVLLLIPLVAAVALIVGAWRLPTARLLPVWGHAADRAELLTAIALVPLLLQVLHVYSALRSLIH
jgi:type VII secretion integral membrane protein EccD